MYCRIRLVSLAAQRLIASVAADAYEIQTRSMARRSKPGKEQGSKDDDIVLTSEVLGEALEEVGKNLSQELYAVSLCASNITAFWKVIYVAATAHLPSFQV